MSEKRNVSTYDTYFLAGLRDEAKLSREQAAKCCGYFGAQSRQTIRTWEEGRSKPHKNKRAVLIDYLWDHLGLRQDPPAFEKYWNLLTYEWGWEPLSERERQRMRLDFSGSLAAPYQAPAVPEHFVGRLAERNRIIELLTAVERAPVIALVGMAGAGKSALAAFVSRQVRSAMADGVLWAHAGTAEPLEILNQWARAYGNEFDSQSKLENRAAAVRGMLADKQALIVLDDVTSAVSARHLLPNSRRCPVLLTTRNEEVAAALGAQIVPINELPHTESVALLISILGGARIRRERLYAERICQRLHHLPLAVEIAAQYLAIRPRRSLERFATRLADVQQRLDLTVADRDVRSSFMLSWDALDAAHQALFSYMAVFEGRAFTAEALAAIRVEDPSRVEEQLELLRALSLVREEEEICFRQHPLLADFAMEKLEDRDAALCNMVNYYHALLGDGQQNDAAIELEWDNIMAAMSAANRLGLWDRIVDYADLLTDVWLLRGDYTRARRGLSWALKSAMELVLPTKRLSYLMRLGEVNFEQDRYEDAQVRFDQCVGLANELGSLERLAECRYWLGRTALESGQLARAREQLAESERLYLQLEEPIGLACVYYQQGQLCYDSDQAEQAKRLCTQALALQTEFEQSVHRIASLRLMADIEIELGDTVAAEQHCLQAQRLCAETNNAAEMAAVLHTLAVIARLQNQLDRAEEYNERALRRFKEMGLDGFTALSLYERSKIQAARNHGPAALKTGLESLRIARGTGQIFNVVVVLNHLAKLCDRLDKQADALAYDREAVELAARHSHPMWEEIQARYRQRRQNPHKSG